MSIDPKQVLELVNKRRSRYSFTDEPVEKDVLRDLFHAAQRAPSSYNEQPWSFIVGVKGEDSVYEHLLHCLVESNQVWARHAPVLVLSLARLTMNASGKLNAYAWHDVGLATGLLLLQAEASGVAVHPMGGFHEDKARIAFNLPEHYAPVAALAIGYAGDNYHLSGELQLKDQQIRPRNVFKELFWTAPVFEG